MHIRTHKLYQLKEDRLYTQALILSTLLTSLQEEGRTMTGMDAPASA